MHFPTKDFPKTPQTRHLKRVVPFGGAVLLALSLSVPSVAAAEAPLPASTPQAMDSHYPIRHVVEIMLENHTYDNLFGNYPGTNGIPLHVELPNPNTNYTSPPVTPTMAGPNEGDSVDINHNRAAEIMMMDYRPQGPLSEGSGYYTGPLLPANVPSPSQSDQPNWRMNYFTADPQNSWASITEFGQSWLPNEWALAQHFTLADHNFQPAIGPTQPNRIYAIAASADKWISDSPPPKTLPIKTVFDQLSHHHLSWKIYQGDYNGPPPAQEGTGFVTHWNPAWYTPILQNKNMWANVQNTGQFITAVDNNQLPNFSFVVPAWLYSEHPPTDISLGDAWLGQVVTAIMNSPEWQSTAIFVTYDEGGGYWDHLPPPVVGQFGYGTRTPMVIISPWVHSKIFTPVTTNMSILSFMDRLWHIRPLNPLNARQNDLMAAFDFHQQPKAPIVLPLAPPYTLQIADPQENLSATPAQPITLQILAKTPGLTNATQLTGPLTLNVETPPGSGAVTMPNQITLNGGQAQVSVTFPSPGYYRIIAHGPDGSMGWATMDVGVSAATPPA